MEGQAVASSDAAGICTAAQHRLLVGQWTHVEPFVTGSEGTSYAGCLLPSPRVRYVVACAPHFDEAAEEFARTLAVPTFCPTGADSPPYASLAATRRPPPPPTTLAEAIGQSNRNATSFLAKLEQGRLMASGSSGGGGGGAGTAVAAVPAVSPPSSTIPPQLLQQSWRNSKLAMTIQTTLGMDHYTECSDLAISPPTGATEKADLLTSDIQGALSFMKSCLSSHPTAVVLIYSMDGGISAATLATLYLTEVANQPLAEVLLRHLPNSTPKLPYLLSLMSRDAALVPWDQTNYFRNYFSRCYPSVPATEVETAMITAGADYARADHLLSEEEVFRAVTGSAISTSFHGSDTGLHHRHPGARAERPAATREAFGVVSSDSLALPSSLKQRSTSEMAASSASEFSICSMAPATPPVALGSTDQEMISSLHRALMKAGLYIPYQQVQESYQRHHRFQDQVLREFLIERRHSSAVVPPYSPRRTPDDWHDSSCESPGASVLGLPTFVATDVYTR